MKMLKKLVSIVTMFAVVTAGLLPTSPAANTDSYDPHPRYTFSYDVHDSETGDFKSQTESRDGDVVQGSYSLNDADGYRRVVEYSSNSERGFNAVVRREPLSAVQIVTQKPIVVLKPASETIYQRKHTNVQHPVVSSYTQPTALVRTYSPSTIIHHGPVLHSTPVHLSPAAHIVHASPVPAALRHQHVVKTSLHTPHVSLVF